VGPPARFYFQQGASWGEQSPKQIVSKILENTGKQSVLDQLKSEILKKLAVNRHAGDAARACARHCEKLERPLFTDSLFLPAIAKSLHASSCTRPKSSLRVVIQGHCALLHASIAFQQ
jgi:hypothetical protein